MKLDGEVNFICRVGSWSSVSSHTTRYRSLMNEQETLFDSDTFTVAEKYGMLATGIPWQLMFHFSKTSIRLLRAAGKANLI